MNKKFILLTVIVCSIIVFVGCAPAEKPLETPNDRNYLEESKMETLVNQINGVENCVVYKDENTAYCGVQTNEVPNNQINTLKQKVSNKIKETFPNINTVYVTTDQLSFDNMQNLKIDNGNARTNKMMDNIKSYFK